eukprot:15473730-Alexandrium_andersonii.AAC.1
MVVVHPADGHLPHPRRNGAVGARAGWRARTRATGRSRAGGARPAPVSKRGALQLSIRRRCQGVVGG